MTLTDQQLGITYDATSWLTSYGAFAWGPNIIVVHSLECDPVPHIAEELSAPGGYLDNEQLAPQRMTDPASVVKCLRDGEQGGHIGGPGNSHCAGTEVSGRASWPQSRWLDGGSAQAAVDHQAKAVAGLAYRYGWSRSDLRWLSIAQIQAGDTRGICTHNDITISGISDTTHWDPGPGFPFAWFLARVLSWFDVFRGGPPPPPPSTDWWDTVDEATARRIIHEECVKVLRDEPIVLSKVDNVTKGSVSTFLGYADLHSNKAETVVNDVHKDLADLHADVGKVWTLPVTSPYGNRTMAAQAWIGEIRQAISEVRGDSSGLVTITKDIHADVADLDKDLVDLHTDVSDVHLDVNATLAGVQALGGNAHTTTYTVQTGDTFDKIARAGLLALNPAVTDPNVLAVGQVLVVPKA